MYILEESADGIECAGGLADGDRRKRAGGAGTAVCGGVGVKHPKPACSKTVQPLFADCTTDQDIVYALRALNAGNGQGVKMGWREIAQLPGLDGRIEFATLNAYALERRPIVNKEHRRIFGLPCTVEAEPCPSCGSAPSVCLCDGSRVVKPPSPTRRKRNRRAVNLDDPSSAARTLRNAGTTDDYRRKLAEELLK